MKIGFTGTQGGMAREQRVTLKRVLDKYREKIEMVPGDKNWFHHGDCIGSDEQAHRTAKRLGYIICIHPPTNESKRAFCETDPGYMFIAWPYLQRNQNIVDNTTRLIATPQGKETLRSGTWSTVRYARKKKKPIMIIWPNGKVTKENWKSRTRG